MNQTVEEKWRSYPVDVKRCLRRLRTLILDVAAQDRQVGPLEEALKWGEPAYLTTASGSGTTIRLGWSEKQADQYGIYVHCQTSLIHTYQTLFPGVFDCDGNRGLLFKLNQAIPAAELRTCISLALRYHLDQVKA